MKNDCFAVFIHQANPQHSVAMAECATQKNWSAEFDKTLD